MVFDLADWRIEVDVIATRLHTSANASDHCGCAYCSNYYETLRPAYPGLCTALTRLGIDPMGPSELIPFTPNLYLACYRVQGRILRWGKSELAVSGIPIILEAADDDTFFLWVGEMELPWIQQEPADDVSSPANLPEFLERMGEIWQFRHGKEFICS